MTGTASTWVQGTSGSCCSTDAKIPLRRWSRGGRAACGTADVVCLSPLAEGFRPSVVAA